MQERERRRFFPIIAARERVVPKKIRLLQIKITTEQAGREAFGKNRRKRIPLQKNAELTAIRAKNFIRRTEMAKNETKPSKNADKYNIRRWSVPSKRAKGYAEDRKAKVHTYGPKEGKELTDYEAGMRSGYLQAQSDHAGLYKYKKALSEGKTKEEAKEISQKKSK